MEHTAFVALREYKVSARYFNTLLGYVDLNFVHPSHANVHTSTQAN